jgi:nucleoside-diphosphate-sugar epimerase
LKVAVTGATGFIGRHVVSALEQLGLSISLGVRPGALLPATWDHHHIVRIDIKQAPEKSFDLLGEPDLLIHLAWGGLPNYQSLHHFESELPAHYWWLKNLVQDGLRNLIVAGTCFEYGAQSGPLFETSMTKPDNAYGLAKDMLRQQLEQLQKIDSHFSLTWARIFYLYGEGQSTNSLLSQLRHAAQSGAALFPMSGGEQLRDYLSVTDAAELLVRLACQRGNHGVVNLCSGQPVSVRSLVEQWIKENDWTIRPDLGRLAYALHEPMAFWGDATKLRHCLQSL